MSSGDEDEANGNNAHHPRASAAVRSAAACSDKRSTALRDRTKLAMRVSLRAAAASIQRATPT